MSAKLIFIVGLLAFVVAGGVFAARQAGFTISQAPESTAASVTATSVVAAAPASPKTYRVVGSVLITPGYHYEGGSGAVCQGQEGYDDLKGGTQVVVTNGASAVIATGQLAFGTVKLIAETPYWGQCSFLLTVENVPYSDFYTISIGHRAGPTYSYDDLAAAGFHVSLSIGS